MYYFQDIYHPVPFLIIFNIILNSMIFSENK